MQIAYLIVLHVGIIVCCGGAMGVFSLAVQLQQEHHHGWSRMLSGQLRWSAMRWKRFKLDAESPTRLVA